jgi:dTDP-4-dehydrorhamnose reductase
MKKNSGELVWVIGAEGLLGRAWMAFCKSNSVPCIGTGRDLDVSRQSNLDHFLGTLNKTPTIVVNCAALTGYDRCEKDPERAMEVNAEGPRLLGQLANKYDFKVIHYSSDVVFEGLRGHRLETSMTGALSVYGKSKLQGEKELLQQCPRALVIRTSWLLGHHRMNFVLRILASMAEQEVVHLVEDASGQPTSVLDLVRWSWMLRAETGIWHLANEGEASYFEVGSAILEWALQHELPLACKQVQAIAASQLPQIRPRISGGTLALEKARHLGIPLRSWEEGLHEILENCLIAWDTLSLSQESD